MSVRVSVLYPAGNGKRFDHTYYAGKHMPMAGQLLGARYEVDRGVGGGMPGAPAPYEAACHFWFDTVADYERAIGNAAPRLMADIPNYTDITPIIQVSEVVSRSNP